MAKYSKTEREAVTEVSETEYKGHPLLVLPDPDAPEYPVQLGVKKLRVVLAHIERVQAFVAKHEPQVNEDRVEKMMALAGISREQALALCRVG